MLRLAKLAALVAALSRFLHLLELATIDQQDEARYENKDSTNYHVRPLRSCRLYRRIGGGMCMFLGLLSAVFAFYVLNERLSRGWRLRSRIIGSVIGFGLVAAFVSYAAHLLGIL
jgi:hypothetical protein